MIYWLLYLFCFSLGLTWLIRRYALAKKILDIPNHRSSHTIPTPRGGGLAFVISFILAIFFLRYWSKVSGAELVVFAFSGGLVALLGFLDDRSSISSHWRFIVHLLASLIAILGLGGMPALPWFGLVIAPGILLNILALLYLCWLLNLYNFMDGIDGIAGVEAISVCLGAVLLYWLSHEYALMMLPLLLAASIAGFLVWNFPPARIFMGDAGSGFLGFVLGVLSIYAAHVKIEFFYSWLILLGVFIVDATVTLFRRLFQRHKIYEAHQSHAYQHASRVFGRHLPVTLSVFIINVFWLAPFAILVGLGRIEPMVGLLTAYVPLFFLAIQFKAGRMGD